MRNNTLFRSKLDAMQKARPVYSCLSCRKAYPATKHARCTKCHHIAPAMSKAPGQKINKTCPNCARPTLKNEYRKPMSCHCGATEFLFFHSSGEHEYFVGLAARQDKGQIQNLRLQVPYDVTIGGERITRYMADFVFDVPSLDGTTRQRVLDYKGSRDQTDKYFKLKKRLVEKVHGIEIEVVD